MVMLYCAIVGKEGNAFSIDIDENKPVDQLKDEIQKKKPTIADEADKLELFLAKKDDKWLNKQEVAALTLDDEGHLVGFEHMDEMSDIVEYIGEGFARKRGEKKIHVLVVVPRDDQWSEEHARKKARSLTVIEEERMNSIAASLNIDNWRIGGIELDIHHVEPDFPAWFYIRKETQDIIKIFKDHMEKKLSTVFVGTPGVGKSMLVVLFAFYMALCQQKRVVLFRKLKNKGFSVLYLDRENKQYWRKTVLELNDADDLLLNADELCLDGFMHDDIKANFGRLARFRLLATSVQYPMKNDDTPVLRRCLVPFWSEFDLNAIGVHFQLTKRNVKERYYYSGGNLRDFLSEKSIVIDSIDQAVSRVDDQVANLLSTQYALGSEKQIDRLRMTSVQPSERDQTTLTKYTMTRSWVCVITSEYALRQLGKIVKPDYYTELWSKARMIGDKGLMGIAFENYVHTMARDGKKIELQVREYDREKKQPNEHRYFPSEFENKSYRYEGRNEDECKYIMQQLENIDYWYPCDRGLKTIDSIAKLNINGNKVGLVQITKRDDHIINSVALDEYGDLFAGDVIYVALVPDKETSDQFRLSPVDPPTTMPLYVAYIATWNS